ncbi:MAG: bifunctional aspartate kinase/homoserine dehydrogenase I [Bacteroidales bacterium]|nr:bifunctional aspartate kinase/homoserine dehydrogenase I [Bacteroidales bacterium]
MQVLKFGGTSVASAEAMLQTIHIIEKALEQDRTLVVSSAVSGCTDTLIGLGKKAASRDKGYEEGLQALQERHRTIIENLIPEGYRGKTQTAVDGLFNELSSILQGVFLLGELSPTSLSAIESFGELFSTRILTDKFLSQGIACRWLDARDLIRLRGGAVDTAETYGRIQESVDKHGRAELFIVPGFIARDEEGRPATLGRGGSDYTASLLAVGIHARRVEIWTDVPGIMTAHPKVVPSARPIAHISYRAAQELSHFGAKVIYPPTIQPVVAEGIPIYVKDTFHPEEPGTLVEKNPPRTQGGVIGIANSGGIALISLEGSGMVGVPGFSSRLFDALSREGINIILITQASSVHSMCIAISEADAEKARHAADTCFAYEISLGKLNPLRVEKGFSIVCVIGDDILGHSGATGQMLAALGRHSIPVRATAQGSSERNISVIVPSDRADEAIRAIHHEFFDRFTTQVVPLFIAGYGRVGKALVEMLRDNAQAIAKRSGKELRVCGIARSKKYVIDTEGIDLTRAAELLENGNCGSYIDALCALSLENPIFIDCTANEEIGFRYPDLFHSGYSIVGCNKIPFSGTYAQFKNLQLEAHKAGVTLRYETTAGAALPVLVTLDRVVQSGDHLVRMEAVLSGTLNYLLDHYCGSGWDALVEDARVKGYTEPDPSIDLSGKDVLRKILILSRQAGLPLEASQVRLEPIPADIEARYHAAAASGRKLRYVASVDASGNAGVGLQEVGPDSPLFGLKGTDNAILITTGDYPSPMLIQGAGAGTRQTAGGLLNDIMLSL